MDTQIVYIIWVILVIAAVLFGYCIGRGDRNRLTGNKYAGTVIAFKDANDEMSLYLLLDEGYDANDISKMKEVRFKVSHD